MPRPTHQRLQVTAHSELESRRDEIFGRLNADPEIARLMVINPVQALAEVNVHLAPDVATHVLHALQLRGPVQERRKALEASLKKRLEEAPKPLEEAWLATAVFRTLQIQPKSLKGHEPVFAPPQNAPDLERLQSRDPRVRRIGDLPRPPTGTTISVAPWQPAFRRLDLEAEVPKLRSVKTVPEQLPLIDLWFYKDDDPAAHDLLELGVILRGAFPIHTRDGFREVRDGKRKTALLSWITDIKFPEQ